MKSVLAFCLFLITIHSFSQEITATATRQDWASGACCQTGTNYVVTIRGNLDTLSKIDIKSAMIDGNLFYINQIANQKNESTIFHFHFQLVNDHLREEILDEKIEVVDENTPKENYVLISYHNQEMKIPFEKIEELFYIAYP